MRATFLTLGLCARDESIVERDLVSVNSSCCVSGALSEPLLFPKLLPTIIIMRLLGFMLYAKSNWVVRG